MDWLKRLRSSVDNEAQAKKQATTKTINDLWHWFVLEADRVYRSSPKAADSWERHKEHTNAAEVLCKAGDISAARAELEKALKALQGVTMTQQNLF